MTQCQVSFHRFLLFLETGANCLYIQRKCENGSFTRIQIDLIVSRGIKFLQNNIRLLIELTFSEICGRKLINIYAIQARCMEH